MEPPFLKSDLLVLMGFVHSPWVPGKRQLDAFGIVEMIIAVERYPPVNDTSRRFVSNIGGVSSHSAWGARPNQTPAPLPRAKGVWDGKDASLRLGEPNRRDEIRDDLLWAMSDAAGRHGLWARLNRAGVLGRLSHDAFPPYVTTALCIATAVSGLTVLSLNPL